MFKTLIKRNKCLILFKAYHEKNAGFIFLFLFKKKKLLIFNPALNLNKSSETKINKSTLHIMWEMTQKSLNHLLPPSGNQLAPPTSQEPPHASWKKCPVAIPRKNYPSDSNETRPTHTHTHTLTHWHTDTLTHPAPFRYQGLSMRGGGIEKEKNHPNRPNRPKIQQLLHLSIGISISKLAGRHLSGRQINIQQQPLALCRQWKQRWICRAGKHARYDRNEHEKRGADDIDSNVAATAWRKARVQSEIDDCLTREKERETETETERWLWFSRSRWQYHSVRCSWTAQNNRLAPQRFYATVEQRASLSEPPQRCRRRIDRVINLFKLWVALSLHHFCCGRTSRHTLRLSKNNSDAIRTNRPPLRTQITTLLITNTEQSQKTPKIQPETI